MVLDIRRATFPKMPDEGEIILSVTLDKTMRARGTLNHLASRGAIALGVHGPYLCIPANQAGSHSSCCCSLRSWYTLRSFKRGPNKRASKSERVAGQLSCVIALVCRHVGSPAMLVEHRSHAGNVWASCLALEGSPMQAQHPQPAAVC